MACKELDMTGATSSSSKYRGGGATKSQTQLNSSKVAAIRKQFYLFLANACKHTPLVSCLSTSGEQLDQTFHHFHSKSKVQPTSAWLPCSSCSSLLLHQAEQRFVDVLVEERGVIWLLFSSVFYSFSHLFLCSWLSRIGSMERTTWGTMCNVFMYHLFVCFSWFLCLFLLWAIGEKLTLFHVHFHVLWNIFLPLLPSRHLHTVFFPWLFSIFLPGHLHPLSTFVHGKKTQHLFC